MEFDPQPGTGCIEADPQFEDPSSHQFELTASSPCIGAGEDGYDMGAYSYSVRPGSVTNMHFVGGEQLKLTWQNPTHNTDGSVLTNLAAIDIYRNGQFLVSLSATEAGATMQYIDTEAINGESYRYQFRAKNSGNSSGWIFDTAEYCFQSASYDAPSNLEATFENGSIGLTWQAPAGSDPMGYRIYRNDVCLADTLLIHTNYTDSDVEVGVCYAYYVTAVYEGGESGSSNVLTGILIPVSAETQPINPMIAGSLSNYPNPFNPETNIVFALPEAGWVELTVFNVKGQKIRTLVNESLNAGSHSVIWHGKNTIGDQIGSGIYWYQLKVNGEVQATRKCLLMK